MRAGVSAVRIALLFPEVLGTYGDGGNATVLSQRLRWRGLSAEVLRVPMSAPVPSGCDVYLIGGGENGPEAEVASQLRRGDGLRQAVSAGAAVLGVCAGLQLLGHSLPGHDGPIQGVGLLPCVTSDPGPEARRAVGVMVVDADPVLNLPQLVGFENHGFWTALDPGARPLGLCRSGTGNGVPGPTRARIDGVLNGRVLGSYLHGPILALNPALADLILGWVVGRLPPLLDPRVDVATAQVRQRWLAEVGGYARARPR